MTQARPFGKLGAAMRQRAQSLLGGQQSGLITIILALGVVLSLFAGSHVNRLTGQTVNNFLNPNTLFQTASDASFFAIMAVGATIVIISGGIDLSIGSIYALAGVITATVLRNAHLSPAMYLLAGFGLCVGIGTVCGFLNGLMVSTLRVHPFIITLGTMWVFRGVAFVASKAISIPMPTATTDYVKTSLGLSPGLYPVPTIAMVLACILGSIYLARTVAGRNVYAVGGNVDASRYSGIRIGRVQVGVYTISGLLGGVAAFIGAAYYGSASCADAQGYELYVIASAVVGGASLSGGKGAALGATLGAILITLIRQSIRTLHFDQNYESIIIGCAVVVAVVLDQASSRLGARRLAAMAQAKQ